MLQGCTDHDWQQQKRNRPRPKAENEGEPTANLAGDDQIGEKAGIPDALEVSDGTGDREGEHFQQEAVG
jgi:hypothetical protein